MTACYGWTCQWPHITCLLAQLTQADTETSIEQVWDRSWPWSIWLTIVVCTVVVLAIGGLYLSERGRASRTRRLTLAALRVTAILLVLWMLAGWNIQRYKSDLPELVLLADNSASMQTTDGASATPGRSGSRSSRWETAQQLLLRMWENVNSEARLRYRPKLYALSGEARQIAASADQLASALAEARPEGEQSRLGDGLIQVMQRQSGRPTAAIVLFSDGIVTSGAPLEEAIAQARRLAIPIYCVATGEQLPQPDLALVDLLADDAVYLGDRVNVQVSVTASDIAAHRATVNLRDMQSGQIVDSAQVELTIANNTISVPLSFVPAVAGSSIIKLEITPAPGEKNLEDNALERVIEVRDQTLRVLIIQKSPSFEFRFLKTLLERTSQLGEQERRAFDLDVVLQDADAAHVGQDAHALRLVPGDRETIAAYDVIIVGETDLSLVASSTQQLIVDQVTSAGCGLMFVCHPGFAPGQLAGWPLAGILPVDAAVPGPQPWSFDGTSRRWQPTTLGQSALPLQLTDAGGAAELWRTLPGPEWHYVPGALKAGAQVLALATSADANDNTQLAGARSPLIISQFAGAGRVVMQTTDETYRWIGYRGSDLIYERYWIQMLRWLSRGKLNRQNQSELAIEPRRAQLGEPIQFSVRLSPDAAAELGSSPCTVSIERIGGDAKSLELQRTQSAQAQFKANDSSLAAGSYRATIIAPNDAAVASVTFTVTAPPGEQADLRSDWRAMRELAEQTHGKFVTANNADELLKQLPRGTRVRRGALPPVPLWNTAWIALAFVCIVTLEWILRRTANML